MPVTAARPQWLANSAQELTRGRSVGPPAEPAKESSERHGGTPSAHASGATAANGVPRRLRHRSPLAAQCEALAGPEPPVYPARRRGITGADREKRPELDACVQARAGQARLPLSQVGSTLCASAGAPTGLNRTSGRVAENDRRESQVVTRSDSTQTGLQLPFTMTLRCLS